jgi:glutaredoxin
MNFFKNLLSRFSNKELNQQKDFIVYYRKLCHDCDVVKKYMEDHKVSFQYIDCEDGKNSPPIPIIATPALFKKDELLAYGVDIIQYLKKDT